MSLTLYSKGLRKGCAWEVSWRLNRLQHIDPKFLWLQQHFFLILLGCLTGGPEGPSPLLGGGSHCLELQLELQLQLTPTNSNCDTGLYNYLTPTCFLWASHLHRIQPVPMSRGYLRRGAPVSWLTAGSKVNVLHYGISTFVDYLIPNPFLYKNSSISSNSI